MNMFGAWSSRTGGSSSLTAMASATVTIVAVVLGVIVVAVRTGEAEPSEMRSPSATLGEALSASTAPAPLPLEEPKLTGFNGDQPEGFLLTQIPVGYEVQAASGSTLVLAKAGDQTPWESFEGKLIVSLASPEAGVDLSAAPLTVHDAPAMLSVDAEASILRYVDNGRAVILQMWNTVGLTRDQLVQFAGSLSVTSVAAPSRG